MFVIRRRELCHGVRSVLQTRGIFWQRNDFRRDDWFITKFEGRVKPRGREPLDRLLCSRFVYVSGILGGVGGGTSLGFLALGSFDLADRIDGKQHEMIKTVATKVVVATKIKVKLGMLW